MNASTHGWSLVLLLASACSFAPAQPSLLNACGSDAECGSARCEVEAGRCVNDAVGYPLALEVVPGSSLSEEPLPTWTATPETLTAPMERDLTLPPYVDLVGRLRWGGARVPAELVFTSVDVIGRTTKVRVQTFREEQRIGDVDADFRVRLATNRMYEVDVRPSSESMPDASISWLEALPPLRVLQVETPPYDPERPANFVWPVELGWPEDFSTPCGGSLVAACTLSGLVVSLDGETEMPEGGLQVRAVDAETGRTVSSTAVTTDEGVFSIVTSPDVERYLLRVNRGTDRELFPTVTVDPAFLFGGDARIRVPTVDVVTYRGFVRTPGDDDIAGATMRFTSTDVLDEGVGLTGSYTTTIETNGRGDFDVDLLAGSYQVVITPPEGSSSVFTEVAIPLSAGSGVIQGQRFELPDRSRFGGVVSTAFGEVVTSIPVNAAALGWEPGPDDSLAFPFNRSNDAVSDETGQFELRLDLGAYDVFVKPPMDSNYSWVVAPSVRVGSLERTRMEDFVLEAPVPVHGRVERTEGALEPGGEVRAWAQTEDGRFIEVGRARIDETGAYELLLPHSL